MSLCNDRWEKEKQHNGRHAHTQTQVIKVVDQTCICIFSVHLYVCEFVHAIQMMFNLPYKVLFYARLELIWGLPLRSSRNEFKIIKRKIRKSHIMPINDRWPHEDLSKIKLLMFCCQNKSTMR